MTNIKEEEEVNQPLITPTLPEGIEDNNNTKLVTLEDGSQILTAEEDEDEVEKISDKDLRNLVQFTTGAKDLTQEELDSLRNDQKELERLIRISKVKARSLTYSTKKDFGTQYKKKRQRRNKMARVSRKANR
jgi:hypothetical protein